MAITSFGYLAFLAVALLFYYAIKPKWQTGYLLIVSLLFYGLSAQWYTILYLLASTVSVYYGALVIEKTTEQKKAKQVLTAVLCLNFGLLVLLKYYGFLLWNVNSIRALAGKEAVGTSLQLTASLGISYYTLQLAGYLLDCYWRVGIVQKDFFRFALFAGYFPQMTSGPVSRYKQIQENLYEEHPFQ